MARANRQLPIELLCSDDGRVLEIEGSKDEVTSQHPGQRFQDLFDAGSVAKASEFLTRLSEREWVFGWELDIAFDNAAHTWHFAGRRTEEGLWIGGAPSPRHLLALLERHHDGGGWPEGASPPAEVFDYDELTRVNNELATLHREMAKQASELKRLNRRQNELLGTAAHDLRNPVAAIHAYSDLLVGDLETDVSAEHLDFLTTIRSTSRFLLELIDDLLDLASIESGSLEIRAERVEFIDILKTCVDLNRVLAAKKRLDLRCAWLVDSALIDGDPRKLRQVIDNLLSNAIKFAPAGSVIDVRADRREHELVVSVEDRGTGIAAQDRDKLFVPFHRGAHEPAERGTGLGLAICRRIIDAHRGSIWVESELGRGSVFWFSLPLIETRSV